MSNLIQFYNSVASQLVCFDIRIWSLCLESIWAWSLCIYKVVVHWNLLFGVKRNFRDCHETFCSLDTQTVWLGKHYFIVSNEFQYGKAGWDIASTRLMWYLNLLNSFSFNAWLTWITTNNCVTFPFSVGEKLGKFFPGMYSRDVQSLTSDKNSLWKWKMVRHRTFLLPIGLILIKYHITILEEYM